MFFPPSNVIFFQFWQVNSVAESQGNGSRRKKFAYYKKEFMFYQNRLFSKSWPVTSQKSVIWGRYENRA